MKLGIKVGLLNLRESLTNLAIPGLAACEVWFDINKVRDYEILFENIKKYPQIECGLHFWGATKDGIWTNMAYPDRDLNQYSFERICKAIDLAFQHGFKYVNIHPGARAKVAINFQKEEFRLLTKPVSYKKALKNFLDHMSRLHEYAQRKKVVLTVETVPPRVAPVGWYGDSDRDRALNVYELPLDALINIAKHGIPIANDFSHTAANIITEDSKLVWKLLYRTTKQLSQQTKLIHLGFIVPPYNGTDYHDMLNNPIFKTSKAVPNETQTKQLLKLFQNRQDIWVIPEPRGNHRQNYFLAQKLLPSKLNVPGQPRAKIYKPL